MQVYPKTFLGEATMYERGWWKALAAGWEAVVYNPLLDMERGGIPLLLLAALALATRRVWRRRLQAWRRRRLKRGSGVAGCGAQGCCWGALDRAGTAMRMHAHA